MVSICHRQPTSIWQRTTDAIEGLGAQAVLAVACMCACQAAGTLHQVLVQQQGCLFHKHLVTCSTDAASST